MSKFSVDKTKISKIIPIEGADRVELAQVNGMSFQFVVGKDQFKVNDSCIYFPVDSLLPKSLVDHFGIEKFLSGKDHNRIKTAKFLKCISQGYVSSIASVVSYLNKTCPIPDTETPYTLEDIPDDLTEFLKIEKYEPLIPIEKGARLIPLRGRIETYDLEGSQRYPNIIEYMMDKKVCISEKLEGMNGGASNFEDGSIAVNQRNFFIEPIDGVEHTFWNLSRKYNLHQIGRELQNLKFQNKPITFRFEVVGSGIQGNIYKLNHHDVRLFDIKVDNKYLNVNEFLEICDKYKLPTVPILAKDITLKEWLNGKTFEEAANGKSILADTLREGIVAKLMEEGYVENYGRCIIKNRSVNYLSKSEF